MELPEDVLNAFRHHGVSRLQHLAAPIDGLRAQRLSASRSFAENDVSPDLAMMPVLNAFRHHGVSRINLRRAHSMVSSGCSTPFGITEFRGPVKFDCDEIIEECSTPFGITEFRGVAKH